jgi:predicted amidohydrolase
MFPELSITGYEPELAKELAMHQADTRLDIFQQISDSKNVTIGLGIPTKNSQDVSIGMVFFQPHKVRETYSKKYLHADEVGFFIPGENLETLTINNCTIAPAICYELSIPGHSENAYNKSAEIYMASVAKTEAGVEKAAISLSDIAKKYGMTVFMSNSVGPSDNFIGAGKSSIWNNQGELLGQLDSENEGILMLDIETGKITQQIIN